MQTLQRNVVYSIDGWKLKTQAIPRVEDSMHDQKCSQSVNQESKLVLLFGNSFTLFSVIEHHIPCNSQKSTFRNIP